MTYLDTHVVVWLYDGDFTRLPVRARDVIEGDDVLVSPIVELELQYLHESGKIGEHPRKVITSLAADLGLTVCDRPLQAVVAQAITMKWTRDPFDRMITAQASLGNSPLITKDRVIRSHYRQAAWD